MTTRLMDKIRAFQQELDRLMGRYPPEPEPDEAGGELSDEEFEEAVALSAKPPEDPLAYRDECEDMCK